MLSAMTDGRTTISLSDGERGEFERLIANRHPRFHCHFTPISASWLNLERFFAEISRMRIPRGTFGSVGELQAAIRDYLDRHNADPKPFMWTKTAETILAKDRRALERLQDLTGCQPTESEHKRAPRGSISA